MYRTAVSYKTTSDLVRDLLVCDVIRCVVDPVRGDLVPRQVELLYQGVVGRLVSHEERGSGHHRTLVS